VILGFGAFSYDLALEAFLARTEAAGNRPYRKQIMKSVVMPRNFPGDGANESRKNEISAKTGRKPAAAAIDTELVEILAQLVTRLGLSRLKSRRAISNPRRAAAFRCCYPAGRDSAAGRRDRRAVGSGRRSGMKSPMVGTVYLRSSADAARLSRSARR
jgi:hypothetical protein